MHIGKENVFTYMDTQTQYDPYLVSCRERLGGSSGAGKAKEVRGEEESSVTLCSSPTSTGDPMAVNLKAGDHFLLFLFFFSPF